MLPDRPISGQNPLVSQSQIFDISENCSMSSLSHTSYNQRRSLGSRASSPSLSDDEDAITPAAAMCPLALPTLESQETSHMTTGQESRRSSVGSDHFELADWEHLDTAYLWRRMLLLQKKLHCYNSARMTAALEDEHIQAIVRE
jgi:hypothetical protein